MALIDVSKEMMLLGLGNTAWVLCISSSMITNEVSGDAFPVTIPFHVDRRKFSMFTTLPNLKLIFNAWSFQNATFSDLVASVRYTILFILLSGGEPTRFDSSMHVILPFVLTNDILLSVNLKMDATFKKTGLTANCFGDNSTFEVLSRTTSKFPACFP